MKLGMQFKIVCLVHLLLYLFIFLVLFAIGIMNYIIKSIINIQVIIIQSGLSGKQQNLVQKKLTFKKIYDII